MNTTRTVKIRSWEDMAEEFGINELGNIKTIDRFVTDMKKYCGKTITLNDNMRYESWAFSEQMFEPEDNYCTTEGCGRKRRKDENMCTTCTIAALRFELTKYQKDRAQKEDADDR